ncbi:MAG: hypothetical protein AABY22_23640, partial [Nanoarchaeota archaeon]
MNIKQLKKEDILPFIEKDCTLKEIRKSLNIGYTALKRNMKFYGIETETLKRRQENDNLVGKRFCKLEVLSKVGNRRYHCKCDCGNFTTADGHDLTVSHKRSCGCIGAEIRTKNMDIHIGEKHNKLTVLSFERRNGESGERKGIFCVCRCDCGNIHKTDYDSIRRNLCKSCGCIHLEKSYKTTFFRACSRRWYFIKYGQKIKCRSGFEVIYANYLIDNNIEFEYEPRTFILGDKLRYTPDFYLKNEDLFIEIKGVEIGNQIKRRNIFEKNYKLKVL